MILISQASSQINLQYTVVGLEIWNLKGYTNWTESNAKAQSTLNWITSNSEKYFDKVPFDDLMLLTLV